MRVRGRAGYIVGAMQVEERGSPWASISFSVAVGDGDVKFPILYAN